MKSHPFSRNVAGFSLVELCLAVGIVAVGFVSVFGLIPTGLRSFRQAMDTSIGAQIAQLEIASFQQTDFDLVIAGAGKNVTHYYDESANVISTANDPKILYWANVRVESSTALPSTSTTSNNNTDLATVTVQIAFNPANQVLDTGTDTLWTGAYKSKPSNTGVVPLSTYTTRIARNK